MAYEKHYWLNGEALDEIRLNYIENGIANAGSLSKDDVEALDNKVQTLENASYSSNEYPSVGAVLSYIYKDLRMVDNISY
jgi:hypothetical protein